jgi:hypothetical protein
VTNPLSNDELDLTLTALEALQLRETEVLRAMDQEALDEITETKTVLGERLRDAVGKHLVGERHRPILERVRQQATLNQLLLIHARDAVRSILTEATGASFDSMSPHKKPGGLEGLRLNVRG